MLHAAVQEERQRAKDRNENEVESTSCANEDMPVEKILEAEQAVEPKTETYIETNLGVPSNSVSYAFFGKHSRTVSFCNKSSLCVHLHARGYTHIYTLVQQWVTCFDILGAGGSMFSLTVSHNLTAD